MADLNAAAPMPEPAGAFLVNLFMSETTFLFISDACVSVKFETSVLAWVATSCTLRKAILRILIALVSPSAISNAIAQGAAPSNSTAWIVIVRAHTFTVYANPSTIRRAGSTVKLWEMKDYNTAQMNDGEPYMSQKTQNEYDCKERRSRILALSLHAENMGGGKVILSDPDSDKWSPVAPGRAGGAPWKFACGKK